MRGKGQLRHEAHREARSGFMFIAPWLFGFITLTAIPMIISLALIFLKWNFLRPPQWVGLQNIRSIFKSPTTYVALKNSLIFMFASAILTNTLSILIANVLAGNLRGRSVFRVIVYLPSLVIGTAFAMMMWPVFGNGRAGLVNQLLGLLGLSTSTNFLGPGNGVWTMVLISIWTIGGSMIIFLAGIKGIDPSYYEAASIDGAGGVRMFFSIKLPLLMPVLVYQGIMSMIGGIQVFDYAIALNGIGPKTGGMGLGNSLATLVYYLYNKAFLDYNMGQGAVIAWMIMIISLVFCLLIFRLSKRYNYQEN